jgi:hypothetical protein
LARLLLRQRAHYLGTVEAPDRKGRRGRSRGQFDLDEEQRKRLAVQEQDRRRRCLERISSSANMNERGKAFSDERQDMLR